MFSIRRFALGGMIAGSLAGSGLACGGTPQEGAARPALALHSAGLNAFLVDARDAALRGAGAQIEQQMLAFVGEREPRETTELVLDVLCSPFDLRLEPAGDPAPALRAELVVHAESPALAAELARRLEALLHEFAPAPASGHPDFRRVALPLGELFFGAPAGDSSFVISLGEPRLAASAALASELPDGIAPLFALEVDGPALHAVLDRWLALGGDRTAAVRERIASVTGNDPWPGATLALGQATDRFRLAARVRGGAPKSQPRAPANGTRTKEAPAIRPLTRAELGWIPADATLATITRVDPRNLEALRSVIHESRELAALLPGVDLEHDVLAALGTTAGFYLSDTTGSGDLASAVAFVSLADPASFADVLERAARGLERTTADLSPAVSALSVRRFEHAGASCFGLGLADLAPLEPSFALDRARGVLFLAATSQGLSAALDQAAGHGAGLLEHPALRARAPQELDALLALRFADTPRLVRDSYPLAAMFLPALAKGLPASSAPGFVLPSCAELTAGSRPLVLLERIEGDDLVVVGEGDRSVLANGIALFGQLSPVLALGLASTFASSPSPPIALQQDAHPELSDADKARADMRAIRDAVLNYAIENGGRYPDSLEALITPDENGLTFLDLDHVPLDPWGHPYAYTLAAQGEFRLASYGRDGAPGGEGEDQDVDEAKAR